MRFFFDQTTNGRREIDQEGLDLRDTMVAERQAVRALFDMARDSAHYDAETVSIEVRDEGGLLMSMSVDYRLKRHR